MTPQDGSVIAISYSHHDKGLVASLVQLLRATLQPLHRSPVFWDREHLEFGKPWRAGIENGIANAHQLFVFWCEHASTSAEVEHEFTFALDAKKPVVPVLLDRTPLHERIAGLHGVDMSDTVLHAVTLEDGGGPPCEKTRGISAAYWADGLSIAITAGVLANRLAAFAPAFGVDQDALQESARTALTSPHRDEATTEALFSLAGRL